MFDLWRLGDLEDYLRSDLRIVPVNLTLTFQLKLRWPVEVRLP